MADNAGLTAGTAIVFVLAIVCVSVIMFLVYKMYKRRQPPKKYEEKPKFAEDRPSVREHNGSANLIPATIPAGIVKSEYEVVGHQPTKKIAPPNPGKPRTPVKPDVVPSQPIDHGKEDYYNFDAVRRERAPATRMSIAKLKEYVEKTKKQEKRFNDEFEKFVKEKDPTLSWDYAEQPQFKPLNRFKNIIPYDHSRVRLNVIDGDPNSDYINASQIHAYSKETEFIACHGPVDRTMPGFWRMVWEKKISAIVMVTNFTEYATMKVNCEQYWPDTGMKQYGTISVQMNGSEKVYADYTIRAFVVKNASGKIHHVKHYQYTGWPDHGVPENLGSLLKMRREVKLKQSPKNPVVVHCRAGIGRTGTYIAIDILLDQAAKENAVDIFSCVEGLRKQRINMVQTQMQYAFLYDVLYEVTLLGDTTATVEKFSGYFQKTRKTGEFEKQFEALRKLTHIPTKQELAEGGSDKNKKFNRDAGVIPSENHRVFFVSMEDGSNPYFNAVNVKGYKHEIGYIATQVPLPTTVELFWKLVKEKKLTSIVCVENAPNPEWYPGQGQQLTFGNITLNCNNASTKKGVSIYELTLTTEGQAGTIYANTGGPADTTTQTVKIFETKDWKTAKLSDRDPSTLIDLCGLVSEWQDNSKLPVLAMCMNGATECGLFICASFAMDMVQCEQELDIAHVTQQIRRTRPQFLPTIEHFKFIHELMVQYNDSFHTYSNFKQ